MSSYVLSCCSTVDLTPEWLSERDVSYLPFNFALNDTWYKDDFGASVSPEELYRRMLAGENATTSQVSVGEYIEHFRPMLSAGQDVLHVTLSSGISRTIDSANIAADQLREEFPERTIHIVDSLCASAGYGLLIDRLAELRAEGMGIDELAQWCQDHRLEVNHLFFSSDLTFFIKGGRVSPFAGAVGKVLKICPLMHVAPDGSLQVKEKIRAKARAKERMLKRMAQLVRDGQGYDGPVFISNSECLEDARDVATAIEQCYGSIRDGKVEVFPIGATIGVHTGPGTVALFFWGSPERW